MARKSARRRPTREETGTPSEAAVPATSPIWQRRWFPLALYTVIALVYFWEIPLSEKVVFGQDIGLDFHKGRAPMTEKVADFLPAAWSSQMGGYPISDEIRHNYFPTYVFQLFTTYQRAVAWRYILTVIAAGFGMYLYLRQIGIGRLPALWGGIAFLSAPTFLSFPYAGHYAKMSVIALFPFFCLCVDRGMNEGWRAARWWLLFPVLIAIAAFSPHLQMLQYALLGIGLYFLFRLYELWKDGAAPIVLAQRTGLFTLAVVLGLGLAAEGLFPPYLHVKTFSKRAAVEDSGRSEEDQLALARSWSLHPEEVGSLLVPEFGGFLVPNEGNRYWGRNPLKLNSEYFGIIVVFLAIVGLLGGNRRRLAWYFGGFFLLVLAFTLGGHTPVHWLAYHLLPGGKVLRATGMAAYLFAFAAIVLAALGLQRIDRPRGEDVPALSKRIITIGAILTGLLALTAVAPGGVTGAWASLFWSDMPDGKRQIMVAGTSWLAGGALIGAFVCGSATALAWARLHGKLASSVVVAGLALLTIADTWRIDRQFLEYENPAHHQDYKLASPNTTRFLQQQPGRFRLLPIPDYGFLSRPEYHLPDANIVTAFNNYTMRRYDRLLREFDGVLSVYSAKFYQGQQVPYSDDQLLGAIDPLLDLVNARYVVTPLQAKLSSTIYPEALAADQLRLYENVDALPFVYLVPDAVVMTDEEQIIEALRSRKVDPRQQAILETATIGPLPGPQAAREADELYLQEYDEDVGLIRLASNSRGPRLLILSQNYHPHWSARVDGETVAIERANFVWQAIYLPAGQHAIEMSYRSQPLAMARLVALLAALAIAGGAGWLVWSSRRAPTMQETTARQGGH